MFQLTIPRKHKFPRREGEIHVLGAVRVRVGVGVEVLMLILKETYRTCNFLGGGGGRRVGLS